MTINQPEIGHPAFTGERVVAGASDDAAQQSLYTIHQAIYRWIAQHCRDQTVLDPGCGTGHGLQLIGQATPHIWGADIAPDAVQFLARHYPALRQRCVVSDATRLGLGPNRFDVVVAVEIIEHMQEDGAFLREVQRVLRPGGVCLLTTPNRLVHSPGRSTPLNPFHVREYTYAEWQALLQRFFHEVRILGIVVHHRGFLIRYHQSQGIAPTLPFPLANIERFLRWRLPIWRNAVVQPREVEFVAAVPRLCWGFLAVCSAPRQPPGGA